jgi:hypothetical protein
MGLSDCADEKPRNCGTFRHCGSFRHCEHSEAISNYRARPGRSPRRCAPRGDEPGALREDEKNGSAHQAIGTCQATIDSRS